MIAAHSRGKMSFRNLAKRTVALLNTFTNLCSECGDYFSDTIETSTLCTRCQALVFADDDEADGKWNKQLMRGISERRYNS